MVESCNYQLADDMMEDYFACARKGFHVSHPSDIYSGGSNRELCVREVCGYAARVDGNKADPIQGPLSSERKGWSLLALCGTEGCSPRAATAGPIWT